MKLICIEGKEKDRDWDLIHPRMVIGRDSVCDVVINDMKLSRIHSEIVYEDDVYIYHDKESRNGSYINDNRVSRQILISGDQIRIGDTVFKALQDNLTPSIKTHALETTWSKNFTAVRPRRSDQATGARGRSFIDSPALTHTRGQACPLSIGEAHTSTPR